MTAIRQISALAVLYRGVVCVTPILAQMYFSHYEQSWFASELRALRADSDVPQISAGLEPMSAVTSHFQVSPTSSDRLQLLLSREMGLSVECFF
jgi:hypothetical protein